MKIWFYSILLTISGLFITSLYLYHSSWIRSGVTPMTEDYFIIKKGATVRQVADSLEKKGYIHSQLAFNLAAKWTGYERTLKAGHYKLKDATSLSDLMKTLSTGSFAIKSVTIPEGLPLRRIAGILRKSLDVDSAYFMALSRDKNLMDQFGVDSDNFEGYLLPETYEFILGTSTEDVFKRLATSALQIWVDSLQKRLVELKKSKHDILTLASIVEGEARLDHERPRVAGLYLNRIRIGMRLQADPTIQYILPDGPRRLLFKDLERSSLYNTYLHKGLPPGPIGNPGKASILAALYPESHKYLYMVADGNGGHVFTKTLIEHNVAVARYNKIMAERRKKK